LDSRSVFNISSSWYVVIRPILYIKKKLNVVQGRYNYDWETKKINCAELGADWSFWFFFVLAIISYRVSYIPIHFYHFFRYTFDPISEMYICFVCEKPYKHKITFENHTCKLMIKAKYKCQFCPQKFTRTGSRRIHENTKCRFR
jgi:hypothetical protein